MSAKHSEQTVSDGIHIIHAFEYADSSARTGAVGLLPTDVGKVARQLDNGTFWVLRDDDPLTWIQIDGGGGGGSGDVTGPASSTDNAVVRFDGTTGKTIQNSVVTIGDSGELNGIQQANFNAISPPAHAEGRMFYNTDAKTLTLFNEESDISLDLGLEVQTRVRNETGSSILKGQVVRISGFSSGFPLISLSQANSEAGAQVIGVASHTIEHNTNGYVMTFGRVENIDTSAFSAGSVVYLSPSTPGALTSTKPSAPNFVNRVAVILTSNLTTGSLMVCRATPIIGVGTVDQFLGTDGTDYTWEVPDHGLLSGLGDDDHTQYQLRSALTTKGDLYVRDASAVTRQAVGTDNQVLVADSAQATGLRYTNVVEDLQTATYSGEVNDGNSGTSKTIDWTAGQNHRLTLTDNVTLTFTNPPGVGKFTLILVQDGTGSRLVTWPVSVLWPGGVSIPLSTAAGSIDLVSFHFDGTNYFGAYNLKYE